MKKEQKNFTMRISKELLEELQVIADSRETTVSTLVRLILLEYTKK